MRAIKQDKKSSTKSPSTTTSVKKRRSARVHAAPPTPALPAAIVSPSYVAPPATAPSAATAVATPSVVDQPPTLTYPAIPVTYLAPDKREVDGYYPSKMELAAMAGVVDDLNAFTDYSLTLGNKVAPAATLAGWISTALAWRALRNETEQWIAYVLGEDALSWKVALTGLDDLKPLFAFAASKDATLVTKYPSLAKLFGVSKTIAKAVKNAKVRKATKAKKAAASAASDAAATAAAAAPAASASAPNPLTPFSTALAAKVPGAS
jgi:hypothetical protein